MSGKMAEKEIFAMDQTSMWRALQINGRVIAALLMREIITRFGRHNFGVLWVFLDPMIFTVGVTILWNCFERHVPVKINITAFAYTGYSTVMLWRNAAMRCGKALEPNYALLFHRNVRVVDLLYSRVILEIAGATMSTLVIGVVLVATGLIEPPKDLLMMVSGWVLLMWFTFGLGMVVGALSERWDWFERIYHPAMYFYLPISGAFFLVDWFKNPIRGWVLWLPTVHVTEMIRHGYFGDSVHTYEDPGYLCLLCLITLFIGLLFVKETQYRIGHQ
jgi:capsular polysaccharide transport system permease protein